MTDKPCIQNPTFYQLLMATQCNLYRALLVCFCLVSVLLIISDRVVFHLYIHIADTSKEAEGLTVVSRKTWMHIRDTQVGSLYSPLPPPTLRCFYELLSSVVRHAEKRYVTSQISTPAKTHLLLPTIRGTQKLIRQKSSGTLKDQSFKKQALFATFSSTYWKICIG